MDMGPAVNLRKVLIAVGCLVLIGVLRLVGVTESIDLMLRQLLGW